VGIPIDMFQVTGYKLQVEVYPNPTDKIYNLQFTMYNLQSVLLKMYDLYGREVRTILDGVQPKGKCQLQVDVSDLSAGIYFVQLQSEDQHIVKKLIVQ
jgi:hypothetical protein